MVSYETILRLMPEILLAIAACWIYVAGAFDAPRRGGIWYAVLGLGVAGCSLFIEYDQALALWQEGLAGRAYGPVYFDLFGYALRCLAILLGFLLVAQAARDGGMRPSPEVLGSILLVVAGLMLVASARDLIILFLGFELISMPTYLLLILGRRDAASEEATVKYFFLSILASAFLLYGFSFLYGLAGSLRLDAISLRTAQPGGAFSQELATLALVLIVGGLGFKIALVPLHFYAPDVYEGTTNLNAGLLSVIPKLAGLAALVRLLAALLPAVAGTGWLLCVILAMVTMTVGNVVALWQGNIRRLLAYSSIAHAGYMLIGIAVWLAAREFGGEEPLMVAAGEAGLSATWVYMVVYVLATVGTFAALVYLGSEGRRLDKVAQLSELSRTRGPLAAAIAVFMFSLAGVPPLAGFWGKLGLFHAALAVATPPAKFAGVSVGTWFVGLAIVGGLNAAISAGYYLRVVAVMYFSTGGAAGGPASQWPRAQGGAGAAWATAFCATTVLAVGLFPGPLVHWTGVISQQPAIRSAAPGAEGQAVPVQLARTAEETAR